MRWVNLAVLSVGSLALSGCALLDSVRRAAPEVVATVPEAAETAVEATTAWGPVGGIITGVVTLAAAALAKGLKVSRTGG